MSFDIICCSEWIWHKLSDSVHCERYIKFCIKLQCNFNKVDTHFQWFVQQQCSNTLIKISCTYCHHIAVSFTDSSSFSQSHIIYNAVLTCKTLIVSWKLFSSTPQGSRWTFQATRMDGEVGSWTIKPDQMQVGDTWMYIHFYLFSQIKTLGICV